MKKKIILFITKTMERIKNEKKKKEHKQRESKPIFFCHFVAANENDILI